MGQMESVSTVTLLRDTVPVGGKVSVHIECDNRACKKPIKSFKLKLQRRIGTMCFNHKKYLHVEKFEKNYGAKEIVKSTVELQIPLLDPYHPDTYSVLPEIFKETLEPDYFPKMKSICPSFQGKLFHVDYVLKVFVKYDGLTERGEGNVVKFPIRIIS